MGKNGYLRTKQERAEMDRFIDMHCHILPGVDDGAQSMEDTIRMLQIAHDEGIRYIMQHRTITRKEERKRRRYCGSRLKRSDWKPGRSMRK